MKRSVPVLLAVTLLSCGKKTPPVAPVAEAPAEQPAAEAPPTVEELVAGAMDTSVDACQDFYRYACGGWLDKTEIPSDQGRWTRSFSEIRKMNEEFVRDVLEASAEDPGDDADRKLFGTYYKGCLDTEAIDSRGLDVPALQTLLGHVDSIDGPAGLSAAAAHLQMANVDVLFGIGVENDMKNPKLMTLQMHQAGLGLPDRAYYFPEDEDGKSLLADYEKHVAAVLVLGGATDVDAASQAAAVVAFETKLAAGSRERAALRNVEAMYHPMDRAGLQKLTPNIPWDEFMDATGYPDIQDINVTVPEFFEALDAAIADTDTVKVYLRWQTLNALSTNLPKGFRDARFAFFGKRMNGIDEAPARWKTCVRSTEGAVGQAIGRIYIAEHFPGDSKKTALDMIERVETSFADGLPELKWMDKITQERALDKLHAITNKIGYPDEWRDMSSLSFDSSDPVGNSLQATEFNNRYYLDLVGGEPDPNHWYMPPQTVNAYYNPPMNEIAFPAGIMQEPFFSIRLPQAMNYGAMGMVMGHEITHGFDDEGRKYRGDGTVEEWWEPQVSEAFEEAATCIEDQYAGYEALPGLNLNGKLTLGENIADNGGIKQAYRAYQSWVADNGAEPELAGLTGDQQFFIGEAQAWCTLYKPEKLEVQVKTDPHSPAEFRVNGPMRNFPEFAEAYGCEVGTPMNPVDRCEVW
jgi:putative endopeptidase